MSHARFRAHEICFETLPDEELLKLFAEHREKQRQVGFRFNDRVAGVGSKQSEMGIYVVDFCRNIYIYMTWDVMIHPTFRLIMAYLAWGMGRNNGHVNGHGC